MIHTISLQTQASMKFINNQISSVNEQSILIECLTVATGVLKTRDTSVAAQYHNPINQDATKNELIWSSIENGIETR